MHLALETQGVERRRRRPWCSARRTPHASMTTTLPSAARSDRAEAGPGGSSSWGCAAGSCGAWDRGRRHRPTSAAPGSSPGGPGRCPSGGRAWRHRRDTSARVLVLWVPRRAAASWAVTTWCITGTLGWMPKTASSSSTEPLRAAGRRSRTSTVGIAHLPPFTALRIEHEPARGSGHGALDQDQLALAVGLDDLEVEGGDLLAAHPAGHPGALEHPGGRGAGADRARGPVVLVVAVAGALALEVVALHAAGEALALADRGHVDLVAGGSTSAASS